MVSCILRTVADLANLTCGLMGFAYKHPVGNLVLMKTGSYLIFEYQSSLQGTGRTNPPNPKYLQ